ncbi:MAG: hypothetical protein KDA41_04905 [Planctomycetales bacterium]|nr:hypothetical protein [Planctomycetales bacterium]
MSLRKRASAHIVVLLTCAYLVSSVGCVGARLGALSKSEQIALPSAAASEQLTLKRLPAPDELAQASQETHDPLWDVQMSPRAAFDTNDPSWDSIVRGQECGGSGFLNAGVHDVLWNPLVVGAALAAGIIIAVEN